jgi:hypothetical protein
MAERKTRLTVTVDARLIEAGNRAVALGSARSISGWVNQALAERAATEERLRAMAEAVAAYEAEYGVITAEEMEEQSRHDARTARVVRGRRRRAPAGAALRRRSRA